MFQDSVNICPHAPTSHKTECTVEHDELRHGLQHVSARAWNSALNSQLQTLCLNWLHSVWRVTSLSVVAGQLLPNSCPSTSTVHPHWCCGKERSWWNTNSWQRH